MDNVYTVREFRSSLKEALDKVDGGERVHIQRNGSVYSVHSSSVHSKECVHDEKGVHRKKRRDKDNVVTSRDKIDTKDTVEEVRKVVRNNYLRYGCGCVKEGGRNLCKEHRRL